MTLRPWLPLLWKEAEETRWFLYAGAAVFIALPVFGSVLNAGGGQLLLTTLGLGAFFAVLVAVGLTCRDLSGGVATFWRSRPIGVGRMLGVKYAVGLVVVLFIHAGALLTQLAVSSYLRVSAWGGTDTQTSAQAALLYHSFSLVLIYSASFLLGCLIRQAVQASILALAAVLLIYFLPVLLPGLGGLSVHQRMHAAASRLTEAYGHRLSGSPLPPAPAGWLTDAAPFAAAMLVAAAGCAVAAVLAVHRDRRLRMDVKLMAWSLGAIALLLIGTGAARLGNTLDAIRVTPLNTDPSRMSAVVELFMSGRQGLATMRRVNLYQHDTSPPRDFRVDLDADPAASDPGWATRSATFARLTALDPRNPEWTYMSQVYEEGHATQPAVDTWPFQDHIPALINELVTLDRRGREVHRLRLLPGLRQAGYTELLVRSGWLYLYALDGRDVPCLRVGLADPAAPGPVEDLGRASPGGRYDSADFDYLRTEPYQTTARLTLPPGAPDLTPHDRLEMLVAIADRQSTAAVAMEGDLIATAHVGRRIRLWRVELDERYARLTLVGTREPTPLETLAGAGTTNTSDERHTPGGWTNRAMTYRRFHEARLLLRGGLLYVAHDSLGVAGVTVYDVTRPETPRQIARYAAPGEHFESIAPLPEGRVLVGGYALHELPAVR